MGEGGDFKTLSFGGIWVFVLIGKLHAIGAAVGEILREADARRLRARDFGRRRSSSFQFAALRKF